MSMIYKTVKQTSLSIDLIYTLILLYCIYWCTAKEHREKDNESYETRTRSYAQVSQPI